MPEDISTRVRDAFEKNLASGREVGAAVSVWKDGAEVASFCGGFRDAAREVPWGQDTLVLIWSATKGMAAACAIHAMDKNHVRPETPVADVWPEFARGGKSRITIADVLSHRAGLGALDRTDLSVLDHEGVARALEDQIPFADAGDGPGYGPRTFGFVVDEIVRRIAGGVTLGDYWRREFADPLGLDLWIGLPEEEHARAADILPPRADDPRKNPDFMEAMSDPASLTRKAFSAPGGLLAFSAMNSPAARSASLPSMGGIGSASALAKFYGFLACGGRSQKKEFFSAEALGWMCARQSQGFDKILRIDTAFSMGFMMDPLDESGRKIRATTGPSPRAFGHPGAGGSLGFADPDAGIGFGYVMNQMEPGVLPGGRARSLVRAVYGSEAEFLPACGNPPGRE